MRKRAIILTAGGSALRPCSALARQSADHAQQADQLAVSARDAATQGVHAAEAMQQAIARIRASAEEVFYQMRVLQADLVRYRDTMPPEEFERRRGGA